MRAYVTGAAGFVGGWLVRLLREAGDEVHMATVDVTDPGAVAAELAGVRPDAVYHLAALAAVGASWQDPFDTVRVNVLGSLAVLDAARRLDDPPRVLLVSSADVYGRTGHTGPITESVAVRPDSPYAASKAAAEVIAAQHVTAYGLPVVVVRPFNHIGPGQADGFLVSALARRIAIAERDGLDAVAVGNLTAERDFSDVRDVVAAYRMLIERGTPGEVYNVCSGVARSVQWVADTLVAAARRPMRLAVDPALLRPVDVPLLVGSSARLRAATGWRPVHDVATTVVEVLDWWRTHLDGPAT